MAREDLHPVPRPDEDLHAGGARFNTASSDESKWSARLVAAGSSLTLIFEIAYLAFDRRLDAHWPWPLCLHLLNIGLFFVAVALAINVGPWVQRHWKLICFSFGWILIASSTLLAIVTRDIQPLSIALMLFLAGTGPFLGWGERNQGLLSVVAITAFGIAVAALPHNQMNQFRWVGILIAAAIGLCSTALERRLHRARRAAEEDARNSREILLTQEGIRLAGQLVSGIAHDLNNTLSVIRLRLDGLMQDAAVLRSYAQDLQSLKGAVDDAVLTVGRVRELGRKSAESSGETAQLTEVVAQAIDLARTTIEGNSSLRGAPIRIISNLPRALPRVSGAPSELRQIFLNLLLNAYQAIEQRGEIRIEAQVRTDSVVVTVADNGPGIAGENLERVFDPFFTTKGPDGTGLGLAITKNILESLGGSITASNCEHRGAIFTLEFPRAETPATTLDHAPAKNGGGSHFLLVDDDRENLIALKAALMRRGHRADAARSGREAIERISGGSYDVVLCDLSMPGMNGWEVARAALQTKPDLNFYIVTGWGPQAQSQAPAGLRIRGVLSKPLDLERLDRIAAGDPA